MVKIKKPKLKASVWIGISMFLYMIAVITNFERNLNYDIVIYAVGIVLSFVYSITGSMLK